MEKSRKIYELSSVSWAQSPLLSFKWEMCCWATTAHLKHRPLFLPVLFPPVRGASAYEAVCIRYPHVERLRQNIVFWRTASLPLAPSSFYHSIFWEWTELVSLFIRSLYFRLNSLNPAIRIWMLGYWLKTAFEGEMSLPLCVKSFPFVISLFCHLDCPSRLNSNSDWKKIYEVHRYHLKALRACVRACVCVRVCVCVCVYVCVMEAQDRYVT